MGLCSSSCVVFDRFFVGKSCPVRDSNIAPKKEPHLNSFNSLYY